MDDYDYNNTENGLTAYFLLVLPPKTSRFSLAKRLVCSIALRQNNNDAFNINAPSKLSSILLKKPYDIITVITAACHAHLSDHQWLQHDDDDPVAAARKARKGEKGQCAESEHQKLHTVWQPPVRQSNCFDFFSFFLFFS